MARKKWVSQSEITPALLKFREKRKWQIALRRYVLEKQASVLYAPYFGLDIISIRKWFEMQFPVGIGWDDFAKKWQFEHIVPVAYFDFGLEEELKMCWNFTNIRVELFELNKDTGNRLDVLAAKGYFETLYKTTLYKPCLALLEKINKVELSEVINSEKQQAFIMEHRTYLDVIDNYSSFEFELLNSGRTIREVIKEVDFLKKF
ncbi:MAG: hypothetical protein ABIR15_14170 [Chitinophagaceae bacterium]